MVVTHFQARPASGLPLASFLTCSVYLEQTPYLSVFACIITNTRIVCVSSVYYLCIIVYLDVLHSEERIALYLRHICLVFLSISKCAIIHERYAPNTHAIGMQYTDPKYAGRDIATTSL